VTDQTRTAVVSGAARGVRAAIANTLSNDGFAVAPMQDEMASSAQIEDFTRNGLGHFTRVYGTRPVEPVTRARWLRDAQRRLVTETRLGIPAIVHEECLTGLAAWQATTFPTPLAWGASFDPELVQNMAAAIGSSMRALGGGSIRALRPCWT
jgi:beta-xylosidase